MAKFVCTKCGWNDKGLSISDFYYGGEELIDNNHWCDNCNEETYWDNNNFNFYQAKKIRFTDLDNIVNQFSEKIQEQGEIPNWEEIVTILRIGGQDHEPRFKATITYQNKITSKEYVASKKEVKKLAIKDWLEKYSDEVFGNNTKKISKNKLLKNVPLKDKIQELKSLGILNKFIPNDKKFIIHALYADLKSEKFTIQELHNKLEEYLK